MSGLLIDYNKIFPWSFPKCFVEGLFVYDLRIPTSTIIWLDRVKSVNLSSSFL